MKNLPFGGSSDIALKLAQCIKNTDAVSSKKINKPYTKIFKIKNYNFVSMGKLEKEITDKYDNILIFNGSYSSSFLSMFNRKNFINDFEINFLIPMEISTFVIQKNILKKMELYILFPLLLLMKIKLETLVIAFQKMP